MMHLMRCNFYDGYAEFKWGVTQFATQICVILLVLLTFFLQIIATYDIMFYHMNISTLKMLCEVQL